jgi:3-oxoacyl-[acyl-carrier protein] reductase
VIDDDLAGLVAIVTGAAGTGIGRAVARRLLKARATVMVTDSHERRCASVAAQFRDDFPGATVADFVLDVGDLAQIDAVVGEIHERFGAIRIVVNNAAVNWPGPVFDYGVDRWRRTLDVNLTGPWYLCRATMPAMRDAGGGTIVNISSAAADDGGAFGGEGVYAITKGALETMTRALAHDGGPHNIRVNTVSMGVVPGTRFIDQQPEQADRALRSVPLGRHPGPDDIAEAVLFLASERSRAITGDIVSINGGYAMRK